MRKLTGLLGASVLALSVTTALGAGSTAAPSLTAYDFLHGGLVNPAEVAQKEPGFDSTRLLVGGVTVSQAVEAARTEGGPPSAAARLYSAKAARFSGEPMRDVYVVVFAGGTFPFDGPEGVTATDRSARITAFIVDATTGEFLRGFMHK